MTGMTQKNSLRSTLQTILTAPHILTLHYIHTLHTPYTESLLTVSNSTMATAPTWAQVARKKKTPAFLPTECAVDLEQFAAPQRLPPSSSRYSAFIPLPSGYNSH